MSLCLNVFVVTLRHFLQRGEAEEELLDAGFALEGYDYLVVGAGGFAGDDDAFAELGVADVVAGGEGFERGLRGRLLRGCRKGRGPTRCWRRWRSGSAAGSWRRWVARWLWATSAVGMSARKREGGLWPLVGAAEGADEVEVLLGAGHADVAEAALLLDLLGVAAFERADVGEDALLHADDEDGAGTRGPWRRGG